MTCISQAPSRTTGLSTLNQAVAQAVATSGYHGRDAIAQQSRVGRHSLEDRIELGQLLVGALIRS